MKIADSRRINAPRAKVYAALNDADALRRAIPGCERLDKESDERMTAAVALRIGPVKAVFEGEVVLSDLNPPESYTIAGSGKGGAAGFASGSASVRLAEEDGATVLSYEVEAKVGGKIAQLGSRLVEGTARKLAGEFFARFGAIVEGSDALPEGQAPSGPAPKPAGGIPGWVWAAFALAALASAAYFAG